MAGVTTASPNKGTSALIHVRMYPPKEKGGFDPKNVVKKGR